MVSIRNKKKKEKKEYKRSRQKSSEIDNKKGNWVICPDCGVSLKSKNLSSHLIKVHGYVSDSKIKEIKKTSKRRSGKATKHTINVRTRRREDIIFFTVIFIIIGSIFGGYFIYMEYLKPDDTNEYNSGQAINNEPQEDDQLPADENWLDNYIPQYFVGSKDNNWWIDYPDKHPESGESVNHLEWIIQDLNTKPVLFVVHRTGCAPCTPQAEKSNEIAKKYSNDLIFYDLDVASGSSTYEEGTEAFMYDPDDAQSYIALTGVFTLIKDDSNKVSICWRSWEGDMEKSVLESWVKDGIYYYEQNKNS